MEITLLLPGPAPHATAPATVTSGRLFPCVRQTVGLGAMGSCRWEGIIGGTAQCARRVVEMRSDVREKVSLLRE